MALMKVLWEQSLVHCDQADEILRNHSRAVVRELDTVHSFAVLWALEYMGELAELSRETPALIQEARERGNKYCEYNLLI